MKVKVHRDCFIDGSRRKAGAVIEYGGPLSSWMEPVEEDAPRRRGRALPDAVKPDEPVI